MTDLFDGYRLGECGAYHEVFAAPGEPRPQSALRCALQSLSARCSRCRPRTSTARSADLARAFRDQGITFSLSGEERPFPLDLVPRVVTAAELPSSPTCTAPGRCSRTASRAGT